MRWLQTQGYRDRFPEKTKSLFIINNASLLHLGPGWKTYIIKWGLWHDARVPQTELVPFDLCRKNNCTKKPLINCRTLGGAVTVKQWRATFAMQVKTNSGHCQRSHILHAETVNQLCTLQKLGFFQLKLTGWTRPAGVKVMDWYRETSLSSNNISRSFTVGNPWHFFLRRASKHFNKEACCMT